MRRPRHRLHRCLSLLASLAALLAGCTLPGGSTRSAALPDSQQIFHPLDVGTKSGDLDSLDPALIEFQSDYNIAQLIFPPLVTLDEHNQVIPWAAQRWEVSADGLMWTFHLRPGMRWSDGTPIDASTYAYSLNRTLDPCTESGTAYYLTGQEPELIKGSTAFRYRLCPQGATVAPDTLIGRSLIVGDAQTFIILLSHPAAYFPAALTYSTAWAQSRQLIERYGRQWTDHLEGFGGSLFTVQRWDHLAGRSPSAQHMTASLVLRRNERFWGTKSKLREIDWSLYPSQSLLWNDFTAGFGDSDNPAAIELGEARLMPGFHQEPDLAITYFAPNWSAPLSDDLRVRQALSLALDRSALARASPYVSAPTIHMVPQGMPGYNPDLKDPAGRTGDAAVHPDMTRAGALWQSYVSDKCGGDAAKCPTIFVEYPGTSAEQAIAIKLYIQQWQAAMGGLKVIAMPVTRGSCHVLGSCLTHLSPLSWLPDYPDPQDFLSLLVHSGMTVNRTHISLPEGDTLLDQADTTSDQAQRLRLYQRAEQFYVTNVAWIPLTQALNAYVVRTRVAGGYQQRQSATVALSVWQRIFLAKK